MNIGVILAGGTGTRVWAGIPVKYWTVNVEVERSFDGIRTYLEEHTIEDLVFWEDRDLSSKSRGRTLAFHRMNNEVVTRAPAVPELLADTVLY